MAIREVLRGEAVVRREAVESLMTSAPATPKLENRQGNDSAKDADRLHVGCLSVH
jgi:hypothetical protein